MHHPLSLSLAHRRPCPRLHSHLTATGAIIGGVLTIAGVVDSLVYSGRNRIKTGGQQAKAGLGFGAIQGKMM